MRYTTVGPCYEEVGITWPSYDGVILLVLTFYDFMLFSDIMRGLMLQGSFCGPNDLVMMGFLCSKRGGLNTNDWVMSNIVECVRISASLVFVE